MVLFLFDAVNGFTVALKRDLDNDDGEEYDDNDGVNVDGLGVTSSSDNNERLLTKYLFAAATT